MIPPISRTLRRSRAFKIRATSRLSAISESTNDDAKFWWTSYIPVWNKFVALSFLVALFVDPPLFYFLLKIEEHNKCISVDQPLVYPLLFLRFASDAVYGLNNFIQWRLSFINPTLIVFLPGILVEEPKPTLLRFMMRMFWFDFAILFPLIPIVVWQLEKLTASWDFYMFLIAVAAPMQFILKLYRFQPFLSVHVGVIKSDLAHFVTNILFFTLAGHVVGSCWYLYGLKRVSECLRKACGNLLSSVCLQLMFCDRRHSSRHSNLLRGVWRDNETVSACFQDGDFPYGIYMKTVNLTTHGFFTRFTYSLFWGYQQVSTLAGNQIPGYSFQEVFFVTLIIGLGLVSLATFIGNMQIFLQANWMKNRMRK